MNISEIVFDPQATAEQIEEAKKWLVENGGSFNYTANYCMFSDIADKIVKEPHIGRPCHRNIDLAVNPNRVFVATENGASRRYLSDIKVIEPFLKWFLEDSYMGRFILNKDDFDFCRDHGFIVSADVAAPLLQNIMITTRHFYEVSEQAFVKFGELRDKNIDGRIAYVLCFLTGWSAKGGMVGSNHPVIGHVGHRAHPIFPLDAFNNFMSGDLGSVTKVAFNDKVSHYRNTPRYAGGMDFFLVEEYAGFTYDQKRPNFISDLMKQEHFRTALAEYRKSKTQGDMYRPPNPFLPPAQRAVPILPTQITYAELFDFVIYQLITALGGHG